MTTQLQAAIAAYRAAHDEVIRLRDLKAVKEAALATAARTHQKLSAGMGERILQATLAGEPTQEKAIVAEVAQGATALKAIEQLLVALDARIANAIQAERSAKANCMRAEAAECAEEAAGRQVVLRAMLDELEAFEGCPFEPQRSEKPVWDTAEVKIVTTNMGRTAALLNRADGLIEAAKAVEAGEAIPWSIVTGEPLVVVPNYLEVPDGQ